MNRKNILLFLIIGSIILLLSSCGTLKGNTQEVIVKSNPTEAIVKIDGVTRGKTPLTVDLDKAVSHIIELSKEGYETKFTELKTKKDGWAIAGDILLFGGLPTLFDMGSSNKLASNEIFVELEPIK